MAWTEQDYIDFYGGNVLRYDPNHPLYGQDLGVGYNRYRYGSREEYANYRRLVTALLDRNLYTPSATVLFIGCGFGYGMAMAREAEAQANRVWGIETSTYIHLNKATESDPRYPEIAATNILNVDFLTVTANDMKGFGVPAQGTFDIIIGENVDESIPANERSAWLANYSRLLKNNGIVVHFVDVQDELQTESIEQLWIDKGLTWQPLSVWASEAPSHYWIATNRREFVAGNPPTDRLVAIEPV